MVANMYVQHLACTLPPSINIQTPPILTPILKEKSKFAFYLKQIYFGLFNFTMYEQMKVIFSICYSIDLNTNSIFCNNI